MMYNYIKKSPVRQLNVLSKLGSSYNLFGQETDSLVPSFIPTRNVSLDRQGIARSQSMPSTYQQRSQAWRNSQSILHISRIDSDNKSEVSRVKRSFSELHILGRYCNLTLTKEQFSPFKCNQARYNPSFIQRILGFFKFKNAKNKKPDPCKGCVACPRKSIPKKVCKTPPPPNIDFQTATKCKEEAVEGKPQDYEIVCPQKLEVGYKEKPPFQSEGGQFAEDRMCKEMPEKRCDMLVEKFNLKREEMEEQEANKQNEKQKLSQEQESSICYIKNKRKAKTCQIGDMTLDVCEPLCSDPVQDCKADNICAKPCESTKKKDECQNVKTYEIGGQILTCKRKERKLQDVESCKGTEKEDICRNVKPCKSIKENLDCTKPNIEDIADMCRNTIPCKRIEENLSCTKLDVADKEDICRNVKPCKSIEEQLSCIKPSVEDKADICQNVKPCKSIETDLSCIEPKVKDPEDICRNVKPCKTIEKQLSCVEPSVQGNEDICRNVKPCKSIENKLSCAELDIKEDKCRNVKPCKSIQKQLCCIAPHVKAKEDICRNVKPCKSIKDKLSCAELDVKEDKCRNVKPCKSIKKQLCCIAPHIKDKEDICRNVKPCKSIKNKLSCAELDVKEDKCRNVKPCKSIKKQLCCIAPHVKDKEDICRNVKPCKSIKNKLSCTVLDVKEDKCRNVKPCKGVEKPLSCMELNVKDKKDICRNVKPCKSIKNKLSCAELDVNEDKCRNVKPCKTVDKPLSCMEPNVKDKADICRNVKPCKSIKNRLNCAELDVKEDKCRNVKPCKSIQKQLCCIAPHVKDKEDICRNVKPCESKLSCTKPDVKHKEDKCRNVKPCGQSNLKNKEDKREHVKSYNIMGTVLTCKRKDTNQNVNVKPNIKDKEDMCRNTKPCKIIEQQLCSTKPKVKDKEDKCRNVKPCKILDEKLSCIKPSVKDKEDKCRNIKPCRIIEETLSCTKPNAKDECRNVKPCKSIGEKLSCTKPAAKDKENNCRNIKSCKSIQKMPSCIKSDVKDKEDKCRHVKSCMEKKLNSAEPKRRDKCQSNKFENLKSCKAVDKKESTCKTAGKGECKKKPPQNPGSCGEGGSSNSCGGSSGCGGVVKFSTLPAENRKVDENEVNHASGVSKQPGKTAKTFHNSLTNIPNKSKDADTRSKSEILITNPYTLRIKMDAPSLLENWSKKPVLNKINSFQSKSGRTIIFYSSSLPRASNTECSLRHSLGNIPSPSPIKKDKCIFATHKIDKGKSGSPIFTNSSASNIFNAPYQVSRQFCNNSGSPPGQRDPRSTIALKEPTTVSAIGDNVVRSKVEEPIKKTGMCLKDDDAHQGDASSNKCEPTCKPKESKGTSCDNIKKEDLPSCKSAACGAKKEADGLKCADVCMTEKPKTTSMSCENIKKEDLPSCKSCGPCGVKKAEATKKQGMSCEHIKKEDLPPCKPCGTCGLPKNGDVHAAEVCAREAAKQEACFDPKTSKHSCNFQQAVVAEMKSLQVCRYTIKDEHDVCPPKKQLCCYQKKEKPKLLEDECNKKCIRGSPTSTSYDCPLCKKFEILDLPLRPKPKKTKCIATSCSKLNKYKCPAPGPPMNSCKKVLKRSSVFDTKCPKCPKPKMREDPPKEKKKPVSIARCSNMPCYQKKCSKKKKSKAPCPTPIKPPKIELKEDPCPPIPCKKSKTILSAAEKRKRKKLCTPTKKRPKTTACTKVKSACDKRDKKDIEREERERREREEKERAYAALKHTDWRAVPIQGDQRWCKKEHVVKNTKCTNKLSKTVLPSTDDPYQLPRYKKETNKSKSPCAGAKPCKNKSGCKNVRKMSSCPIFEAQSEQCAKNMSTDCSTRKTSCEEKDEEKKALEKKERENKENEERHKAYAALRHSDWRPVPIQVDERWCRKPIVMRSTKSESELSKNKVGGNNPKSPCSTKPCALRSSKSSSKDLRTLPSCHIFKPKSTIK